MVEKRCWQPIRHTTQSLSRGKSFQAEVVRAIS